MTTISGASPASDHRRGTDGWRQALAAEIAAAEAASPLDPARLADLYQRRFAVDLALWAERTAPPGAWFDVAEAEYAAQFFPLFLRHSKGRWAGHPFELEAWQAAVVKLLFGWKLADGRRRFRFVYVQVPRKNGKTQLAAGLALLLAFFAGEAGAEVYSAATDKEQAFICFNEAKRMRAASPHLRNRTTAFKEAIVAGGVGAAYKVISSESKTKDGLNVSGAIYDELHAWTDRLLFEVLHTATGARAEPVEFAITTAGADKESLCWEMREYALKVRDGIVPDPEFLPVVFEAPEDADYLDPRVWARANPNLGKTIAVEYLAKEAQRAKELPRYRNAFKRLHLNVWTEQVTLWLPMDRWDACPAIPLSLDDLAGRTGYGGLDLSSTTDLTALAILFPRPPGDPEADYDLWCRFWMPRATVAARSARDRVPYDLWAEQGWIALTEGDVIDYDAIRVAITGVGPGGPIETEEKPLIERVDLAELAIDRWNATQITTQLSGDGVTVVPFGQGFGSLSAPSKEFERLVQSARINHMGNPVLRWMASCAEVKTDAADNVKPVKPDRRKNSKRIDGIVAAIMGLGRAGVNAAGPARSFWESPP